MTSVPVILIRPADRNAQWASAKFLTCGLQDFQGWAVNCVGSKVCHQNVTQLFQNELSSFPHVWHCISWCSQNPCLNSDPKTTSVPHFLMKNTFASSSLETLPAWRLCAGDLHIQMFHCNLFHYSSWSDPQYSISLTSHANLWCSVTSHIFPS